MESRRLPAKSLLLIALFVALAVLFVMPTSAIAIGSEAQQDVYNDAVLHVTVALTSEGIVATPTSLSPGNHLLTIENNTSEPRGIEMIGIDSRTSPTVRYSKVLRPGESETFRWFLAPGKTVYVRDILTCGHDQMSCMLVTFGEMAKDIEVN